MTVCFPKTKEDMFQKQACLLRACWYSILRSFEGLEAYTRLPALVGTDLFRVTQANKQKSSCSQIPYIAVSLENPSSSLFWSIPCVTAALSRVFGFNVQFTLPIVCTEGRGTKTPGGGPIASGLLLCKLLSQWQAFFSHSRRSSLFSSFRGYLDTS